MARDVERGIDVEETGISGAAVRNRTGGMSTSPGMWDNLE